MAFSPLPASAIPDEQVTRFASMRGVFDKQGKPFKCDVTGNDKNYGFNVVNVNSTELVVFEAAIDLMSYVDIFADYESNKLALGMLIKHSPHTCKSCHSIFIISFENNIVVMPALINQSFF